jgi:hypothetical protein
MVGRWRLFRFFPLDCTFCTGLLFFVWDWDWVTLWLDDSLDLYLRVYCFLFCFVVWFMSRSMYAFWLDVVVPTSCLLDERGRTEYQCVETPTCTLE